MNARTALVIAILVTASLTGCGGSDRVDHRPPVDTHHIVEQASRKPADSFGNGTHQVLVDIKPGTYRTIGPKPARPGLAPSCYWARLNSTNGGMFGSIIVNDFSDDGPAIVTIAPSDTAFVSHGCDRWVLAR